MKLSWSHKLFLRINERVGERPWLDQFMIFCARWLIYIIAAFVLADSLFFAVYGGYPDWRDSRAWSSPLIIFTGLFFLFITDWLIGLCWKHRRPVVELPNVKTLVHTISTWKSFPSDHTAVAFYFCFHYFVTDSAVLWWSLIVLVPAILVAVARVYVGVHYPRDIIGGFVLGLVFARAAHWLTYMTTYEIVAALIL